MISKKSTVTYGLVFFFVFCVEFGINSFLSFNLQKEQYLFYINIINIIPLLTVLSGFGTSFSVIYLTSLSKSNSPVYLFDSNTFVALFGLLLLFLFIGLFELKALEPYLIVALILSIFNAIKQNYVNFFLAKKSIYKSSFVRLNQKLVYLTVIACFFLYFQSFDEKLLSVMLITGELIGFLILLIKYKLWIVKKFTKIKLILKVSKYAFLSNIFSMISLATPIFLLNYFKYPEKEIISFSIAYTLCRYSGVLFAPLMQLITPFFTPIRRNKVEIKRLYIKFFKALLLSGVIINIIMYFLSEQFITIFFNNDYNQAAHLFKLLSIIIPITILSSFTSSVIASTVGVVFDAVIASTGSLLIVLISIFSLKEAEVDYLIYIVILHSFYILFSGMFVLNKWWKKHDL